MVRGPVTILVLRLIAQYSSTCGVCYALSFAPLPCPFQLPENIDGYAKMRSEREWFKNVKVFPTELPSLVADSRPQVLIPVNEIEQALADKTAEIFNIGVEEIARNKSLFLLGLNSIIAIRMVSWIRQEFKAKISVPDIFREKSILRLSSRIAETSQKIIKIDY